MTVHSFNRKQLHEMIDAIPDDMVDEIFEGFTGVLVNWMTKRMGIGFKDKLDELNFIHEVMEAGGPEKNKNVIRMPKNKK